MKINFSKPQQANCLLNRTRVNNMSLFDKVPLAPPDPILGLAVAFAADTRPHKVNLGVGLYKDKNLKTPVLQTVKTAEKALLQEEKSKEYLPIDGDTLFKESVGALVFGEKLWKQEKERIAAFQTVGGTAALKIGGTFLKEEAAAPVWVSSPTWSNHPAVFASCGLPVESYPYYDPIKHQINVSHLIECFDKLPKGTIINLHACCHNPTGFDPSLEEWEELAKCFKKHHLLPFFDMAYQGLGRSLDADAEAIRLFLREGIEMLVAISNAKNFGIYGERVGSLFIVSDQAKNAEHIRSRAKQIIRTTYSNPPMHGAKIVSRILSTPSLHKAWEAEVAEMQKRIGEMRSKLSDQLATLCGKERFHHLAKGKGMFKFTGLTPSQVERMIRDYAIYLTKDGRINVCGLNESNANYVAESIASVIE